MANQEKAQHLLEPGNALLIARVRHIQHMYRLTSLKSVDLVALTISALSSIRLEQSEQAERYLSELLAVLIAKELELNEALGFELMVRDDAHKVQALAMQILLGEADDCEPVVDEPASPLEIRLQEVMDESVQDEE